MYFIQININAFPRFKKTKQHYFRFILLFELIALALNIKMKFIEDYSCSKKFLLIFGLLMYEIVALFISVQLVAKEDLNSTGLRILIVISIIAVISAITYLITKLTKEPVIASDVFQQCYM